MFCLVFLIIIYLFGCVGSSLSRGLSLVAGILFVAVLGLLGLLIVVASLVAEHGL